MSNQKEIPQVDIENIIRNKNEKLLKWLPGFVLRYIKKILHEKDMNEFLRHHHHQYGLDFTDAILNEFGVKVKSHGLDNIPKTGGFIVASNHPLGGLDAIALMDELGKVRSHMKFLVNDILMNLKNLEALFVPVNKHGKNAAENIQRITETYSSENATLIFPAGLVSRKQNGVVQDLSWQKSFITQAVKHQKNIIPVFIDAYISNFFYNVSFWRKKLGIKANIEMFYLVNEMYKQRNKSINIIFGEAIPYATFTKEHSDTYWAEEVKKHVYKLKDGKKHLSTLSK